MAGGKQRLEIARRTVPLGVRFTGGLYRTRTALASIRDPRQEDATVSRDDALFLVLGSPTFPSTPLVLARALIGLKANARPTISISFGPIETSPTSCLECLHMANTPRI